MTDQPVRPRLGDQHFGIATAAVRAFAAFEHIGEAEARRDLERLLVDAKQSESRPDRWRLRSKALALDMTATTRHDADRGHLVVVALECRLDGNRESGDQRRRRKEEAAADEPRGVGRPPRADESTRVISVRLTEPEHAEIAAELREEESISGLLRSSGLATARARARARGRGRR